jgi:hypothetical protein
VTLAQEGGPGFHMAVVDPTVFSGPAAVVAMLCPSSPLHDGSMVIVVFFLKIIHFSPP